MNIKKIIVSTILLWVIGTVFAMLTCGWLFNWVYTIPPNIWKPASEMMSMENTVLASIAGILKALFFVLVFAVLYNGIPGEGIKKGLIYGLLVWILGAAFGTITMPLYMTISTTVVIYWILQTLVLNLINGLIVGKIYK